VDQLDYTIRFDKGPLLEMLNIIVLLMYKSFQFSDDALKKSANKYGSQNEKSAAEIEEQIIKRSRTRVHVGIIYS
jgi:hypothetical protein